MLPDFVSSLIAKINIFVSFCSFFPAYKCSFVNLFDSSLITVQLFLQLVIDTLVNMVRTVFGTRYSALFFSRTQIVFSALAISQKLAFGLSLPVYRS